MRQFLLLSIVLSAIPMAASTACRPPKWTVGQTVHTTSGPVDGHAASKASEVSEYLGIPYAKPPLGNLRFQPPVSYNGTQRNDGRNFDPACIPSNISAYDKEFSPALVEKHGITDVGLKILETITNIGIQESEDCLTLNVWTKPQTGEKKKAVMVYLHGGSFVSGSSAVPAYNGQFFADQEDVVIVSINYRVTFFGFPGNPITPQNIGLLDQRLAVEWVRDNIASFSGDPLRITLFRESAGGASVDHYSFAWPIDPIVSGFIPMSGTAKSIRPRPLDFATELWFNTSSALGCGNVTTPSDQLLSFMQAISAEAIVKTPINTIDSPTPMPYSPTIDDVLVFTDPAARPVAKVPMLIGTTDNECGLFRVFIPQLDDDAFWETENQNTFVCPAAARTARSASEGNPTWRYRWHGVFPNTRLGTKTNTGAYHDSEMAVLFRNVDQSLVRNTKEEKDIGRWMRGAWTAFAKNPKRGLLKYGGRKGWPMYVEGEKTLARIGWENRTETNLVDGKAFDHGC